MSSVRSHLQSRLLFLRLLLFVCALLYASLHHYATAAGLSLSVFDVFVSLFLSSSLFAAMIVGAPVFTM